MTQRWAHFWYCDDESDATTAADTMRAAGWTIRRLGRSFEGPGWAVVAERDDLTVTPDIALRARAFFYDLAQTFKGGEYDGDELTRPHAAASLA
jgi:hypothetical protein